MADQLIIFDTTLRDGEQSPGASMTKDCVLSHCAERFAKWQLPDDVLFVDAIPLTSTGKIDKKRIRADLGERGYTLPDLADAKVGGKR